MHHTTAQLKIKVITSSVNIEGLTDCRADCVNFKIIKILPQRRLIEDLWWIEFSGRMTHLDLNETTIYTHRGYSTAYLTDIAIGSTPNEAKNEINRSRVCEELG